MENAYTIIKKNKQIADKEAFRYSVTKLNKFVLNNCVTV